jgi:hypothetical protein
MKSADKVQRLLRRAGVTTHGATDDGVFENLKKAYTETIQHKSARCQPSMWRFVMKSPITRLAAAAVVLIAGGIGLSLWRATGSGVALADVLARLEKVKAFRCKETRRTIHDVPADKASIWEIRDDYLVSKEHGSIVKSERLNPKGERANATDIYFNPATNTLVLIEHMRRQYIRMKLNSFVGQQVQKEFNRHSDPAAVFKEIAACKYASIGQSTIDGIEAECFCTTDPNYSQDRGSGLKESQVDVKLWIDIKTRLPVRYESLRTGLDKQGAKASIHVVMYSFQWDVPVDASKFEPPTLPDGYTTEVENLPETINERAATEGLKQCTELFGKYPENLLIGSSSDPASDLEGKLNKSDTPAAVRLKEELQGLAEQEKAKRLADARLVMVRSFLFYMNLTSEKKDPAYYGKTVTPKDADKVLMRWKLSDTEYRVIFGDLHAETVSPEKLAELERGPAN